MVGVPVVAIDSKLARANFPESHDFYEVDTIIRQGKNGFIGESVADMRKYIEILLKDFGLAKQISDNARQTAINIFGKDLMYKKWQEFLAKSKKE